jgi:sterol desaturase/sphingolipid hydroxylase (fatty acid hydroxylase superfamily)
MWHELADYLQQHASAARLVLMLLLLSALLALEARFAHRRIVKRGQRLARNLSIAALASAAAGTLAFALPILSALGAAHFAAAQGFGVFYALSLPQPVVFLACMMLLDAAMYWQHRWMHRVPLLWRMHRVHHLDAEFDVSLGLRFHPFEIVLSMLYKAAVVSLLGAPVLVVIVYEMTLMSMSLLTHVNVALPQRWQQLVGYALVTPDLHRVHHACNTQERDRNYANFLSIWDRVFGSYAPPRADSASMPIGVPEYAKAEHQRLLSALGNPLQRD